MKQAILLYNEKAGRGKIAGKVERIVKMFSDVDCVLQPRLLSFDKNPFDSDEKCDFVIIAGGDGTINYVVNAMMNKGLNIPLAVIPTGMANDFAGALGMSADVMKAVRQIIDGEIDNIDCGLVEQIDQDEKKKYFINIFSFGIFTTTSQHTPQHLKKKVGRFAYLMEGLKELRTMHGIPLTITTDEEKFYFPTLMGLVLNGETAGRMPLMRKSSLKDGVFDCLFLLWGQETPLVKNLLEFGCHFDHFSLCKELRERDAETITNHFESFDRGGRVTFEEITDGRFAQSAFL